MDAYVFVRSADAQVLDRLRQVASDDDSAVRFAAAITGPYDAIVAISAPDLTTVQQTVYDDVRGAGAIDTETVLVVGKGDLPEPRRNGFKPFEAFIQMRTEPGRASDVLDAVSEVKGVLDAALVAGPFDLLVEAGGDTFEQVSGVVLNDLQSIPGVLSTQSFFTQV